MIKLNFDELIKNRVKTYFVFTLDLTTARANDEFRITGHGLFVLNISPFLPISLSIRLNESMNDSIDLRQVGRKILGPFYRFFITHPATTGCSATLLIWPDENNFLIEDFGPPLSSQPAGNLTFGNLTLTNAATEYSLAFLANVKQIIIKARQAVALQVGASGQSGTTYFTIPSGGTLQLSGLCVNSGGLWFGIQCATAGTIVEYAYMI